jgi:beta-RFAP synthase
MSGRAGDAAAERQDAGVGVRGHAVRVESSARLHLGVLDLRGARGRWFGGLGAAAASPSLLISARPSAAVSAEGADASRAEAFARRFLAHHGLSRGVAIEVHRALPSHAGLGSGTQLALSVARAIAELYDVDPHAPELARAVGRARRSAIGTWTFERGGLVVEGGRHPDRDACGPLVARLPFPPTWRCVLAIPDGPPGLSGSDEEAALAALPPPSERDVERVAHLVLMALLPALADGDLRAFGQTLAEIQDVTGRWFATVQGGAFARGPSADLVGRLREWGAVGVGQSSWGPAVYGLVDGDEAGRRLASRVREAIGPAGQVYEGPFRSEGARVWRD